MFVGQVKWHNQFLQYLAHICVPLTKLTKQSEKFIWGEQQNAFDNLKIMLMVAPILQPHDWDLAFHVFVDALNVAIGAVLMQECVKGWYQSIYYANRVMPSAE